MSEEWQGFRDRLTRELAALPVGDSLLVTEPDDEPAAGDAGADTTAAGGSDAGSAGGAVTGRRRWWQRGTRTRTAVPGRYVQFQRWPDLVRAECISGAFRDVSEAQHRSLLDLGWSDPAGHPAQWRTDNYVYDAEPVALEQLADLCARSLEVLGARPDGPWTWQVNS